jgi:F0F1-type ATP synthase assembly protein I
MPGSAPDNAPEKTPAGPTGKDPDKSGMATVGRYLSVGIMLPVSSMVGYGIGYELDQHFGTHWMAIVLMLLGTVGGFIQLIREISR